MEKKFAIYSRKSKFTGKGESIENQIEMCKEEIRKKEPDLTDEDILVYEDEGYSGKNTNRPQFQQMMKDVRNKKIKEIVCYRLDRISRNVGDCSRLIDELQEYGVNFNSISEHFDTSIPMGRAMYNMCSTFAQLERETIAERIRDNMHELAKTGRWLGGNTPTGYKSTEIVKEITIDGKKRKAFMLELIPEEAEIIKLIFSKFIEYNSLTQVETYFLKNHIKTKNDKAFTRFTLKAILRNPVYMIADDDAWKYFEKSNIEIYAEKELFDGVHGVIAYNKTLQRTGKASITRDVEEWIIAVGKHKGIVSGEAWAKAQEFLNQNSSKSYRKSRSHTALLSGLLICGKCGGFMRPKMYNRDFEEGEKRFSYLCETKEKSRQCVCDIKNPNGNILDRKICEEIKKLSEDSGEFFRQLENAKKKIVDSGFDVQIEKLHNIIADKKKKINALIEGLENSNEGVAAKYISERIEVLHNEIKAAEQSLNDTKKMSESNSLSNVEFDILKNMLSSFAASFDTMNIEQKRTAIRTFVKKVVWDGENIHMYLHGSEDDNNIPIDKEPIGENCK